MKIIEATTYRTLNLKIPKTDYRGDPRYQPHEETSIHIGYKAEIQDGDDPAFAVRSLHAILQGEIESLEASIRAANPPPPVTPRPPPRDPGSSTHREPLPTKPITDKQVNMLRYLANKTGKQIAMPKTSLEASRLIQELQGDTR